MKLFNRQTGNLGENLATDYLKKHGCKIIERNFRTRFGEIDLIYLSPDRQTLIFVEVKTKTGNQFGSPEDMINRHKLTQVYRMSQIYLKDKPIYKNITTRIDVIAVILNPDKTLQSLTHHESVY